MIQTSYVHEDPQDRWTFAELSPMHWFEFFDPETIIIGSGGVSQVTDKGDGGYHATQTTASLRPIIVPEGLNGHNIIRFNGTSQFLSHAFSSAAAKTVFMVIKRNNTGPATQSAYSTTGPNTRIVGGLASKISTGANMGNYYGAWRDAGFSCLNWVIAASTDDGAGNVAFHYNGLPGNSYSSQSYYQDSTNRRFLGGIPTLGEYCPCDLAAIVSVPGVLTADNLARGFGRLAHQLDMVDKLPGWHPYKNDWP